MATRSHHSVNAQAGSSLDVYRTIYGRAAVEVGLKVLAKVKLRGREYRITAGRHRVDGFISLEGLVSKVS